MIENIIYWLQIIAAVLMVVFVVLQPSKGSDLGSMAGGTTSNGNKSFIDPLTKVTAFLLAGFMSLSFMVSYLDVQEKSVEMPTFQVEELPSFQVEDTTIENTKETENVK